MANPNTNFNTVVNSNVILYKIFLELSIPNKLLKHKGVDKSLKSDQQNLLEAYSNHHEPYQEKMIPTRNDLLRNALFRRLYPPFFPINRHYFNYGLNPHLYELHQKPNLTLNSESISSA